ncbi:MAG: PilZ domain-containing protein [Desulfurivibrionaceae bacterium]|nr:PilZ domain-containing protein [Desulfurivibrionaceae bacterium]
MTEQQNDRRRDVRVVFRTTVRVIFPDGRAFADCETCDISVSGVFVNGVTGVAVGERCRVELQLTGNTSDLLLKMTGEIVRSQEEGVALEFAEVDEDSFYHLQNIVYFSYKHAGTEGRGDFTADLDNIEDETLYLDLNANGKSLSLAGDYPAGIDFDDEDDFDADFAYNIAEHVKRRQGDDDD